MPPKPTGPDAEAPKAPKPKRNPTVTERADAYRRAGKQCLSPQQSLAAVTEAQRLAGLSMLPVDNAIIALHALKAELAQLPGDIRPNRAQRRSLIRGKKLRRGYTR